MTSIFKKYRRHDDLIVKGARCVVGKTASGKDEVFFIARAHESYPAFQQKLQSLLEENSKRLEALPREESDTARADLVMDAFVATCIKGWENIVGDDEGNLLEYTEENILKLRKVPELLDELFKFSARSSNYVGDFDENKALK